MEKFICIVALLSFLAAALPTGESSLKTSFGQKIVNLFKNLNRKPIQHSDHQIPVVVQAVELGIVQKPYLGRNPIQSFESFRKTIRSQQAVLLEEFRDSLPYEQDRILEKLVVLEAKLRSRQR